MARLSLYLITFLLAIALPSSAAIQAPDTTSINSSSRFYGEFGVQSAFSSGRQIPFWLHTNRFGAISTNKSSVSSIGKFKVDYSKRREKRLLDWGLGADLRLNFGKGVTIIPVEAYVKARIGVFQILLGRSQGISGLVDSTLSTGSFAISGNALGIPKIELSVPNFWSVPVLGNFVSFKGSFSNGFMGRVPIHYEKFKGGSVESFFHSSSLYTRLGTPQSQFKVYMGINHEVIWGSDKQIFGNQFNLNKLDAFFHVISGKTYSKDGLQRDISKVGNHLGTIDTGIEYINNQTSVLFYRQFFYEKGALRYLANLKDGITGISINNKHPTGDWAWSKLLFELFYSKDQAGERDAKKTPSGPEYYYNHGVYKEGYSYKGRSIGSPLLTEKANSRQNLPHDPSNYFINTRVIAFHFGMEGRIDRRMVYLMKLTYSKNYGDYKTSNEPYWLTGGWHIRNPVYGVFPKSSQFSGLIELNRSMNNNFRLSWMLAIDHGKLLNNSVGGMFKAVKRF